IAIGRDQQRDARPAAGAGDGDGLQERAGEGEGEGLGVGGVGRKQKHDKERCRDDGGPDTTDRRPPPRAPHSPFPLSPTALPPAGREGVGKAKRLIFAFSVSLLSPGGWV